MNTFHNTNVGVGGARYNGLSRSWRNILVHLKARHDSSLSALNPYASRQDIRSSLAVVTSVYHVSRNSHSPKAQTIVPAWEKPLPLLFLRAEHDKSSAVISSFPAFLSNLPIDNRANRVPSASCSLPVLWLTGARYRSSCWIIFSAFVTLLALLRLAVAGFGVWPVQAFTCCNLLKLRF